MYQDNLLKGFEVELFTGTFNSHIGVSSEIAKLFQDFVEEPDNRNVEYITAPSRDYRELYKSLIQPRINLRQWLYSKNLTIIPSSTLCFNHDKQFKRSDNLNNYHDFIEHSYGTTIATSSVHINLGVDSINHLFAAIRLARCEAALYLSLSASSPFLNGQFTGNHSQRWIQFPKTPLKVPFFEDHNHYVSWIKKNLEDGKMQNIRHFWSSIRPNGPDRPHQLDRLELRICDFISDPNLLLGITALLELRTLLLLEDTQYFDPLLSSKFSLEELQMICDHNESEVARDSLNAKLVHWKNGQKIFCKDWILNLLDEVGPISNKLNMSKYLKPIYKVLGEGNKSMEWIEKYNNGSSIEEIMKIEINKMLIYESLDF